LPEPLRKERAEGPDQPLKVLRTVDFPLL